MKGNVRVEVDPQGLTDLVNSAPIMQMFNDVGGQVSAAAASTASDAEKGEGGRITGYAAAGFTSSWVGGGTKRPRIEVKSNADGATATAVHFSTQKRWGVAHLRKALYSITNRG